MCIMYACRCLTLLEFVQLRYNIQDFTWIGLILLSLHAMIITRWLRMPSSKYLGIFEGGWLHGNLQAAMW